MGEQHRKTKDNPTCPACGRRFERKWLRQVCCTKACARKHDWLKRERKQRLRHSNGYILAYVPGRQDGIGTNNSYILEHRLVMEQTLGRRLDPRERVHHRNGIRDDNRLENLELWTLDHKDPPGIRTTEQQHCATCRCFKL